MRPYLFFILFQVGILIQYSGAQCTVSIAGDNSVCQGDTVTLVASGAASYTWMPGSVISDTLEDSPSSTTIYTLTAASGTCVATSTIEVNVNQLPDPNFLTTPEAPCKKACYYSYCGVAAAYLWDFGNGSTADSSFVEFCYYSNGTYTITLTVTSDSGCTASSSQSEYVMINSPVASFSMSPQPTTLNNPTINFTDLSSGWTANYEWHFGDPANSTSTTFNPSFTYSDTGHYHVQLKVSDIYGCADSISKYAVISAANGINIFDNGDLISVSPNPIYGEAFVLIETEAEEAQITDQLGRGILKLENDQRLQRVDLSKIDKGIYYLRVSTAHGIVTRKIIKE